MLSRRELVWAAAAVTFRNDTLNIVENLVAKVNNHPEMVARDEDFWSQIQQAFTLDRNVANMNNGGCSPSPRVVQEVMRRQLELSNQAPSNYMWRILEPEIESVRTRLGKLFAVDPEEVAITRNASESLETLIYGFDLKAGDEIITTNLDYPRMVMTIQQRERRDGVKMITANCPSLPKTMDDLYRPIENAVTDKTRMIVVSQISFLNGQIFPIKKIAELGRKHNIPVIVDGAHAFVQYEFDNSDIQCDFYGTSLHKWLMAPIGTGMLYVKKDRIKDVWSMMSSKAEQAADIRKFEEIGTHPAANHNAIGEAITFHEMLGMKRKEARLRYLRSRWVDKVKDLSKVHFCTNLNPAHSCAITTVGIEGIKQGDLANWLLTKHGIFVTTIATGDIQGIRVTPNVYTTVSEINRLSNALVIAATKGIG